MTMVMSSFLAGAEMMTFLAPPSMCALAFCASVKKPVDSTMTSAPTPAQSMLGRVALLEDANGLAVHDDRGLVVGDLTGEAAQDRVVLEQVGEGLVVHEVVGGHDLDVGSGRHDGAEEVAADAAKAVDTNANGHCCAPLR